MLAPTLNYTSKPAIQNGLFHLISQLLRLGDKVSTTARCQQGNLCLNLCFLGGINIVGIELEGISFDSIFPSFINIHTEIVPDSRSKFIGIVGEVSYRIMGDVEAIQVKQINALADFALYAGIGRKTTMGMGMGRRVKQF